MTRRSTKVIADICLYGSTYNAGWLAAVNPEIGNPQEGASIEMLGDGEPMQGRSLNHAVWMACRELCDRGYDNGVVRVFEPSGQRVAKTRVDSPGYFGDLKWMPARQYAVSAEQIEEAAA